MKIIYFFLFLLLIPNVSGWYNTSYESKIVFNITGGCKDCVINITTPVTKSDRWVNEIDNTPLSFWNQSLTNVWVNLTSDGSYQISKYINNSNQYDSLSNGSTTFIQFHGYSETQYSDTPKFTVPFIYEAYILKKSGEIFYGVDDGTWNSNSLYFDDYSVFLWAQAFSSGSNTITIINPAHSLNTNYSVKISAKNSAFVSFYGHNSVTIDTNTTTNIPTTPLGLMYINSGIVSGTGIIEYAFVRKYNDTEPVYTYYSTEYLSVSPCSDNDKLFNYYYPSNVTLVYGTLISNGHLCSLYNIDNLFYRYEETVNPQGLLINITFNNVSEFKSILVNFEYTGTDTIFLQIYNHNINSFISVDSATNDMPSTNFNIEVNNYLDYIKNGTVVIRFNNPVHGNPIYNFNLNRILLLKNNFYPDSIYIKTNNILYKIDEGNLIFKTFMVENITGNVINYLLDSFIVLNTENYLYKINSSDGNIIFKTNILNIKDKTITNSYIYVKTKNNLLYTINKDTGEILYKTYILGDFEFMERRLI